MSKKILLIGDIHIGKTKKILGTYRQANDQAKATFTSLLPLFKELQPDLVINMGDTLSDSQNTEVDKKHLGEALSLFKLLPTSTLYILGNHELRALSLAEIQSVYSSHTIDPQFFGLQEYTDYQCIWLDLELDSENKAFVPEKTIKWLEQIKDTKKPTIVFSHYSLQSINAEGSFYFENNARDMYYQNYQQVITVLDQMNVVLCVNAHTHLLSHQVVNNVHYISNPSFSENIAAGNYRDNNPGIYSVLELKKDQFIFSSFSGRYCFAKIVCNLP